MKFIVPVEISSKEVVEKRGTSKTGVPYSIREQRAYLDFGRQYPTEFKIPLDSGALPYEPGKYIVDPDCLYVDRYGGLSLGRVKLRPTPQTSGT